MVKGGFFSVLKTRNYGWKRKKRLEFWRVALGREKEKWGEHEK